MPDVLGVKTRADTVRSWSIIFVIRWQLVSHSKIVPLVWPVAKK
jgi:hypothetical protein